MLEPLEFVHDQLATGRRFRVLNVVDDVTRECLRVEAGLDRTYVSGIERRVKNPTVTVVRRVADALDCKMGELLD